MSQPPAHTDDDADEAIVTRCLDGAQAASNGGDTEELKAKLSTLALEMKRSSLGVRRDLILPRVRDLIESNISRDAVVLACIRVLVAYEAVIRARENPVNNDALDEEIVELVFSSATLAAANMLTVASMGSCLLPLFTNMIPRRERWVVRLPSFVTALRRTFYGYEVADANASDAFKYAANGTRMIWRFALSCFTHEVNPLLPTSFLSDALTDLLALAKQHETHVELSLELIAVWFLELKHSRHIFMDETCERRVREAFDFTLRATELTADGGDAAADRVQITANRLLCEIHEWHDFLPEAPHMASLLTRQLITCSAAGTERIVSLVDAYMRDRETPNMGFIGEAWQAGLFAALFQRVMQDNRHVPDLIFTQPTQMIELLLVPGSQPLPLLRACHAPDLLLTNLINASDNVERSYPRESRVFLQILYDDSSSTVTF